MKTLLAVVSLIATSVSLMAGCTSSRLNPYGLPYDGKNVMPPGPLTGCWVPEGVDTRPTLKFGTKPLYPIGQLMKGAPGAAEIRFSVAESGQVSVQNYETRDAVSFANHGAIALRDWEVLPATKNGKTIAVNCSISFSFVVK